MLQLKKTIPTWTLVFAVLTVTAYHSTSAVKLEDFLGGRPLTKERIINDVLDYYKQPDPMGIPVLEIPEPFILDKNLSTAVVNLYGLQISGQSGVKLQHFNINATDLKAKVLVMIPWLEVISTYSYAGYWSSTEGEMNLTFVNLGINLEAYVGADLDGNLKVTDLEAYLTKDEFLPEFKNAPFALSALVSTADILFDTLINSRISSRVEDAREKLNERLSKRLGDKRFPPEIHPLDMMVLSLKQDLKAKFDPLPVKERTLQLPAGITLQVTNCLVRGLSSVHRTHEISVEFVDNRLIAVVQIGTQDVSVSADVELSASILPSLSTNVEFSIDNFSVWVELQQAADVTHPPVLRRIKLNLGNFRLLTGGESTVNYALEAAINILPNALRNTIVARIEPILHQRIQRRLNTLDVEEIIQRRLNQMKQQQQ